MKKKFKKYIVLAIPFLIFLIFLPFIIVSDAEVSDDVPKLIVPFISTFLGASLAFFLNNKKDAYKEDRDRISALRVALFIIAQQQNVLAQMWKTLHIWKNQPDKVVNMRPLSLPDSSHLRQNLTALAFVIEKNPGLLIELTVEDERFAQTIAAITRHSEFHVKEVQPALEKSNLYRKVTSVEEMEKGLGGRIFGTASANAEQIFDHLIPTRKSLAKIMPRIFEFAKSIYPDEKFLQIELGDEPQELPATVNFDFQPILSAREIKYTFPSKSNA